MKPPLCATQHSRPSAVQPKYLSCLQEGRQISDKSGLQRNRGWGNTLWLSREVVPLQQLLPLPGQHPWEQQCSTPPLPSACGERLFDVKLYVIREKCQSLLYAMGEGMDGRTTTAFVLVWCPGTFWSLPPPKQNELTLFPQLRWSVANGVLCLELGQLLLGAEIPFFTEKHLLHHRETRVSPPGRHLR